jgi:hypothetical protein
VHITIHAPATSGMARYTEFIPDAATVHVMEQGKSDFREEKGKLKFIWTDFPAGTDVRITYTLIRCENIFPDYPGILDCLDGDGLKTSISLLRENIHEMTNR